MSTMPALTRGGLPVTPQQAAIVDSIRANPITVAGAGAGAGKTYTLVAAVMEELEHGASADRFVVITFTNKAAGELRERLDAAIRRRIEATSGVERAAWLDQQERLSAAYVGTIHSFALRLLRLYGYESRVPRTARMITSQRLLAAELQDALEVALGSGAPAESSLAGLDLPEHGLQRLAQQIFAAARSQGLDLRDIAQRTAMQPDDTGKPYRVVVAELLSRTHDRYLAAKQRDGVVDADDLLTQSAALLADPDLGLPQRLAERFDYLFVDEFQDTDRTQKHIVDALTPALRAVLVIGDRKQSIYRFRAAQPSLLDEIAEQHDIDVLPLNVSRRPTKALLDAQNALFGVIGERYRDVDEPLEAHDGMLHPQAPLPPFLVDPAPSEHHDAVLARRVRWYLQQTIVRAAGAAPESVQPGDIAILARSNKTVETIVDGLGAALAGEGIAVRPDRGVSFYARPEIVSTYRMLRLLVRYPDDSALSSALRTPYLAAATDPAPRERDLLQYGTQEGRPLTDWFEQQSGEEHQGLVAGLADLRRAARLDTAPQLLGRLYERFRIREHYAASGDRAGIAGLELLRERARNLFDKEQALTLRTFTDWLGTAIAMAFDEEDPAEALGGDDTRPAHVRVMTIHRAKGLEFPIVIVPRLARPLLSADSEADFLLAEDGLDLGLVSRARSPRWEQRMARDADARRAEEIRLFYVAVTRAQHSVALVGGGTSTPSAPGDDFYSWRDEVYRARPQLVAHGARFG